MLKDCSYWITLVVLGGWGSSLGALSPSISIVGMNIFSMFATSLLD
jgi:hypothetical protein